jgi:MFS family permease
VLFRRIAVNIAFFVNGFVFANWVARLPRIQELFNADDGTIGLVLLSSAIGAVGAMPFAGWAIHKLGSRGITIFSASLYCVLVPAISIVPNLTSLIALYFFMGIATGILDVAMNAQAILVEQEYRRSIITSFHAFFSIGMMIGAAVAALFTNLKVDLLNHLSIVSGISLVAIIWMQKNLVHDSPDPALQHDGPAFRLPNKSLVSIGIITFCGMIGEGALSDWSVNYMENIALASKAFAPLGLSAFATAMTIGRIFGDRVRTKYGDKKMIVSGGLLSIMGLTLAVMFALPSVTIVGFFLVGIGLSSIVPIAYSIAGNVKGLPAGVGIAMVTTVGYAGFLFGPPVIGFIADWQTLRIALSLVTLLFIIMTVLGSRYDPMTRQD